MEQGAPDVDPTRWKKRSKWGLYDPDCMADLAATAKAHASMNLEMGTKLEGALDSHIVSNNGGRISFACGECAVKCSLETVDGETTFLFENEEACTMDR